MARSMRGLIFVVVEMASSEMPRCSRCLRSFSPNAPKVNSAGRNNRCPHRDDNYHRRRRTRIPEKVEGRGYLGGLKSVRENRTCLQSIRDYEIASAGCGKTRPATPF